MLSEASVAEEEKNTISTSKEHFENTKSEKADIRYCQQLNSCTCLDDNFFAGTGWMKTAFQWVLYGLLLPLCFFPSQSIATELILSDNSFRTGVSPGVKVSNIIFIRILLMDVALFLFDQVSDVANGIQFLRNRDIWRGTLSLLCIWTPGMVRPLLLLVPNT